MGHLHRDSDDVDLRRRDQRGGIGKSARQPGLGRGLFGTSQVGIGDADDVETLG
jgi:hypothetical protein